MSQPLRGVLLCLPLLLLAGCFEESVVVKVQRDGSGVVHIRSHQQKVELGFALGGKTETEEEDPQKDLPTETKLKELANSLGAGVRLESVQANTNPQGWHGFEVVFAFDDINTLVLNDQIFGLGQDSDKDGEDTAGNEADSPKRKPKQEMRIAEGTRFRLQGDRLLIIHDWDDDASTTGKLQPPSPTRDPFAEEPKASGTASIAGPQMEKIMAQALKDARLGLFLELEGGIGETNARFHNDAQVTLYKVEVGPLLEQRFEVEKLTRLSKQYRGDDLRSETQKLADRIKGLDVDLQDQISIQFAN